MVTSLDVYKEIRRLQLEGVTSQRAAARQLGISRNTVKKYWEGNAVPWERKEYSREAAVMTPDVVRFIASCLDEDEREQVRKQKHTARRIYERLVENKASPAASHLSGIWCTICVLPARRQRRLFP